jgi:hypothetical protein
MTVRKLRTRDLARKYGKFSLGGKFGLLRYLSSGF